MCSYSQEYLSLLSRRRLLKAVKKENKWFTTVLWLTEYLADKKPDEVVISRKKATQLFEEKRGGTHGKYWAMVSAAFLVLIVVVAIFSQMSNKISELKAEARNSALSQARADALAGFDPSVLEVKSPPKLDSQVLK